MSSAPGTLTSHSARFASLSSLHDIDSHNSSLGSDGGDGVPSRKRRSRRTCTWTGGSHNPHYAELAVQLGNGSDSGSSSSTPLSSVDTSLSSRQRRTNDGDGDEKSLSYPPVPPTVRRSSSASDLLNERDGNSDGANGGGSGGDTEVVLSRSSLRSNSERRKAPTTFSGGPRCSKGKETAARSVTPPSRHETKKKSRTLRMKRLVGNHSTRTLPMGLGSLFKPRNGGKGKSSKSLKLQQGANGRSRDGSLSSVDSMDYSNPEDMMSLPASHTIRDRHGDSNNLALPGSARRPRRNSAFHAGTWSRGRSNSSASASDGSQSKRNSSTLSSMFSPAMNMMRGRSKSPAPPGPAEAGAGERRMPVAEMERLNMRGADSQLDARDRDQHRLRSHSAAVPLPGAISTTPSGDKRRDRRHRASFGPDHSPKHSSRNTVSFAPQSPTSAHGNRPHPISASVSLGSPTNTRKSSFSPSHKHSRSAAKTQVQSPTARSRSPPASSMRSPRHHRHTKSVALPKNVPVSPTHRGTNVSFGRKVPSRHSTLVRSQTSTSAAFSSTSSGGATGGEPSSGGATSPVSSPTSKKKHSSRSLRKVLTRQNTAPRVAIAEAQKAQKREKSKKKQKQKERRTRLRKSYSNKAIDTNLDSLPQDD